MAIVATSTHRTLAIMLMTAFANVGQFISPLITNGIQSALYFNSIRGVLFLIGGLVTGLFVVSVIRMIVSKKELVNAKNYFQRGSERMGMTIKEASEQLGIPAHTIRHYEKEGLIPFLGRDEYGNRIFKSEDVEWIRLMTCFRVTGMPINQLGESTLESRKQILEQLKDLAFEAVNRKLERYREIQKGTIDEADGIECIQTSKADGF